MVKLEVIPFKEQYVEIDPETILLELQKRWGC